MSIFSMRAVSWAIRGGCVVHFVHANLYEVTETYGESMLPTLSFSGDFVHASKLHKWGKGCEVGDMVILTKPTDPELRVCKRICGKAGDIVLVDPSAHNFENYIKIPKGHVWVTGDNLTQSLDSRSYGFVPAALIKGKVFAAYKKDKGFVWMDNILKDVEEMRSEST